MTTTTIETITESLESRMETQEDIPSRSVYAQWVEEATEEFKNSEQLKKAIEDIVTTKFRSKTRETKITTKFAWIPTKTIDGNWVWLENYVYMVDDRDVKHIAGKEESYNIGLRKNAIRKKEGLVRGIARFIGETQPKYKSKEDLIIESLRGTKYQTTEPKLICPDIGKIQSDIAEYMEANEVDQKLYDLLLGSLYSMDAVKLKITALRKWGHQRMGLTDTERNMRVQILRSAKKDIIDNDMVVICTAVRHKHERYTGTPINTSNCQRLYCMDLVKPSGVSNSAFWWPLHDKGSRVDAINKLIQHFGGVVDIDNTQEDD